MRTEVIAESAEELLKVLIPECGIVIDVCPLSVDDHDILAAPCGDIRQGRCRVDDKG